MAEGKQSNAADGRWLDDKCLGLLAACSNSRNQSQSNRAAISTQREAAWIKAAGLAVYSFSQMARERGYASF
jgi:hypothetical protein